MTSIVLSVKVDCPISVFALVASRNSLYLFRGTPMTLQQLIFSQIQSFHQE